VPLAGMGPLTVGLWDEDLNPVPVPSSCGACRTRLIKALRAFNLTQNLSHLNLPPCPCQDSGVRIQESGVRSQNEEHLPSAFCFLPSAFCFLLEDRKFFPESRILFFCILNFGP